MFHAHVSAKDIPRYQVFLAGALACRFQRSEAAMRNSLIWNLQGDNVVNGTTLPTTPTSWSIVGIGSFGGNGQSDILFHNASGQNLIWVMGTARRRRRPHGAPAWGISRAAAPTARCIRFRRASPPAGCAGYSVVCGLAPRLLRPDRALFRFGRRHQSAALL